MDENEPFDPRKSLAELRALAPAGCGRKLSLDRQCAAYAALWNGIKLEVVMETFGLSRTSVSNLAGCRNDPRTETKMTVGDYSETFPNPSLTARKHRDRRPHYPAVKREYERLGEDEFLRVYYTPAIAAELRNTIREMGLRK
jgi:hypothetical protein